jgi:hypothetical protein
VQGVSSGLGAQGVTAAILAAMSCPSLLLDSDTTNVGVEDGEKGSVGVWVGDGSDNMGDPVLPVPTYVAKKAGSTTSLPLSVEFIALFSSSSLGCGSGRPGGGALEEGEGRGGHDDMTDSLSSHEQTTNPGLANT